MPRKLSVGPEVVALAGVVVDDVEDDLDAGRVQRLHHRLELVDDAAARRCRRVAHVGREETDRVVAPVVDQAARAQKPFVHRLLYRKQLDRGHTQGPQMSDGGGVRKPTVGAPQLGWNGRVELGEAPDVDFVKNAPRPRNSRRSISRPIECIVHHHAAGHRHGTVDGVEGRIVDDFEGWVRQIRPAGDGAGVGVEEQLLGVEA